MKSLNQRKKSVPVIKTTHYENDCLMCEAGQKNFLMWARKYLYMKQSNFIGRYMKIVNNIIKSKPGGCLINFKDIRIWIGRKKVEGLKYKDFSKIVEEISPSIKANIKDTQLYGKPHLGQNVYEIMLKNQVKKKELLKTIQFNQNKVKLSTSISMDEQILDNSELKTNYEFHPVELFQKQNKSKFQMSLQQISKLKKNLSFMINEIKTNQNIYPETKNIQLPFVQFVRTKEQAKFRKNLELSISSIHEQTGYVRNTQSNTIRMNTLPDPHDDSESDYQCTQAYGFMIQQNPRNKKLKKTESSKNSKDQSSTKLSKTKITSFTNSSKLLTQRGSFGQQSKGFISSSTLNSQKQKNNSKIKQFSGNKVQIISSSNSKTKIKKALLSQKKSKSTNKSKKHLQQNKQ